MSSTIIFNVAVWKWHADAAIPIHGSNVGSAVPNCYVCTRNGYVTKVSNSNEETPSLEDFDVVIDGKGRLLLPGLMGKRGLLLNFRPLYILTWTAHHMYRFSYSRRPTG